MTRHRNMAATTLSRRDFVQLTGATGLGLLAGAHSLASASTVAEIPIVAEGPWGRIERLAEGIWAVVSTPLAHDDWTTLCNGGILAGRERVLVVESFARPAGARLVAEKALELTGQWPTDVLVTHYHGDHANGLEGFVAGDSKPVVWMTATTRRLIGEADALRDQPLDPQRAEFLQTARTIDSRGPARLDLGGLDVRIHSRQGHTASDVTVELEEPSIVFCGDLVWNQMFPNFRDTLPTALSESVDALHRETSTAYVPGHGPLATGTDVARFKQLIDAVEAAARSAIESGVSATEAAARFSLPDTLREWHLFRQSYFEVAIGAWYKEIGIESAP